MEGRPGKRVAVLALGTQRDVWTASRVTAAWGARRDVHAVEVVAWDITKDACALLPGVTKVHGLRLANLRTRAHRHALAGAVALRASVDGIIDGRPFDVVLNLSYGEFAGHLAPLFALDPHAVVGPFVDDTAQWRASHPAFEYLATWGIDPTLNVFAMTDVWSAGAHVRTDEGGLIARDTVAETLVDHDCGEGLPPILVAPTNDSESWLGFEWEELVSVLTHAGRRTVTLLAPSGQSDIVERVSARTGASIARWPLRHEAALLRRCGMLVTADPGLSAFAARTGARQLFLHHGTPLPIASLPGPHVLCIAADERPVTLEAAVTFGLWHLLQRETSDAALRAAGSGLSVAEFTQDGAGCLCTRAVVGREAQPRVFDVWRRIWRDAWIGLEPNQDDVRRVLDSSDATRLARARLDRGLVGRSIRDESRKRDAA